jgi:hypothetical protein
MHIKHSIAIAREDHDPVGEGQGGQQILAGGEAHSAAKGSRPIRCRAHFHYIGGGSQKIWGLLWRSQMPSLAPLDGQALVADNRNAGRNVGFTGDSFLTPTYVTLSTLYVWQIIDSIVNCYDTITWVMGLRMICWNSLAASLSQISELKGHRLRQTDERITRFGLLWHTPDQALSAADHLGHGATGGLVGAPGT